MFRLTKQIIYLLEIVMLNYKITMKRSNNIELDWNKWHQKLQNIKLKSHNVSSKQKSKNKQLKHAFNI